MYVALRGRCFRLKKLAQRDLGDAGWLNVALKQLKSPYYSANKLLVSPEQRAKLVIALRSYASLAPCDTPPQAGSATARANCGGNGRPRKLLSKRMDIVTSSGQISNIFDDCQFLAFCPVHVK